MSPKYSFTKKEVLGALDVLRNTNWGTPPHPCNIVMKCEENGNIELGVCVCFQNSFSIIGSAVCAMSQPQFAQKRLTGRQLTKLNGLEILF